MESNYILIKNKIDTLSQKQADKYIDKMYNNGIITSNQLMRLDNYIFKTKVNL